ncbi:MAG: nitrogen regulation protein NR(I) [Gammaproteobacteria bacterium]|nr:nitrogen regulation protein NR(I) [Gammaproteobacteria bacterium]
MNRQDRVWIIDDDDSIRWVLDRALQQAGMATGCYASASGVLDDLRKDPPDVVITDIRMHGMSGLKLLEDIGQVLPHLPVIVMTAHSDLDSAVSAYQGGAFEYLPKPFDVDHAVGLVRYAIEHRRAGELKPSAQSGRVPEILGAAPAMQEVFRAIGRLSGSHITVLINGESGTGKELVARALHNHSPRARNAFVALNIAAIPAGLLESELFGHERGAFTGALTQRRGRFEQADNGTLFLDEIGDMPAELQTRLLRVLSDGQFYRVGGCEKIHTNVRVIAATHQNLEQRVADGLFREDLFHRLNVIRVHVPPLRDRRQDIPVLARHFLAVAADELKVEGKQLAPEAEQYLCKLPWPGNVRQLENTCRWLTVMAPGRTVRVADFPAELKEAEPAPAGADWRSGLRTLVEQRLALGEESFYAELNAAFESTLIEAALNYTGGRKQDAAKRLGLGRNTLTRKLKDLNLDP